MMDFSEVIQNNISVQTLLKSISEGVVFINKQGQIVFVNSKALQLFEFEEKEMVGQFIDILIPNRFKNNHGNHIKSYFTNPKNRSMGDENSKLLARKKSGEEFPVEISLSFINSGNQLFGMAFITDISARVKIENELQQRNLELDAYAHTVAHDLQSQLNSIIGFGQILLNKNNLTEEKRNYITELIVANGTKMSNIIQEILFYANRKKEDIEISELNMNQIVDEAIQRINPSERKNIEIKISPQLDTSYGCAPLIEEVWYNYIRNAIRYGGNPPKIEIGSTQKDNGYNKFWIKDNGKGLNEYQIKFIFSDPQKMGEGIVKGNGLGLSIVQRIVKRLDGWVYVESEIGKGSKFSFYLPTSMPEENKNGRLK